MKDNQYSNCFSREAIYLAWERVLASLGLDAKDYFGIEVFKANLDENIVNLSKLLINCNYNPSKPFKYFEPKAGGTQRTKTVLKIEDAIVYQAMANLVAELNFDYFGETKNFVFGSVLSPDVKKGTKLLEEETIDFYFFEYYVNLYNRFVNSINNSIENQSTQYRLETDITSFFDSIPHSTLIIELNKLGISKQLLDLLSKCLNFWCGTRDSITIGVGIPQGPAASYFFANVILDSLDRFAIQNGLTYYRFMDDIRIYDTDINRLNTVLVSFDRHLTGKALALNASKTSIKKVSHTDDEKGKLLDSSGIKIKTDIESETDVDILDHDSTQESLTSKKNIDSLDTSSAIKLYYRALDDIEVELFEIYTDLILEDDASGIFKEDVKLLRKFLTLSQKWRLTVSNLVDLDFYQPNDKMVPVWFFGIRNIFWKANTLVWNFTFYDSIKNYRSTYERISKDFGDYEWVHYQLLAVFDKFVEINKSTSNFIVEQIKSSESPLVRLGYYKILIDNIKINTQVIDSVSQMIKLESEPYVKNMVLHLIQLKNLNIPIEILKKWFL